MESNNASNIITGHNPSPSRNSNSSVLSQLHQKAPLFPSQINNNRHPFEVLNLGHHSLPQQNPFCITTSTKLFPNPHHENFSSLMIPSISSPGGGGSINGNGSAATDDVNEQVEASSERNRRQGVMNIVNDTRRLKRIISNRESARRSRMRRKMQVEELQCLASQLQKTNRQLSEKLIQLLDSNQQIVQENSQLKEKVSSLQILLSDLLVPLRNNHVVVGDDDRAQASTPSATVNSMKLLH
ncbi:Basic-leucine zipper transcription factor [Parasponia andersonii]|uniref:Basic-leucine zipper transcription factor n=1 Tax=Parasponia andersonii TaxID=3476 RepID=A0A2P5AHZ6_PARAD|nr:Basic-leucine zipper transcription factor [Parasponia andersonii]